MEKEVFEKDGVKVYTGDRALWSTEELPDGRVLELVWDTHYDYHKKVGIIAFDGTNFHGVRLEVLEDKELYSTDEIPDNIWKKRNFYFVKHLFVLADYGKEADICLCAYSGRSGGVKERALKFEKELSEIIDKEEIEEKIKTIDTMTKKARSPGYRQRYRQKKI